MLRTQNKKCLTPRKLIVILATTGVIGGIGAYHKILFPKNTQQPVPTDTVFAIPAIKDPVVIATYHNDTIDKPQTTLLLYSKKKIKRYYFEGHNAFMMQLPYFVHEWWHGHNDGLKYRMNYNLSPEEYFKLCLHDEISANLAAILTARFEYLGAKNKQAVIQKYKKTYMKFYFEAIEKKQIKPTSNNSEDREKEWHFLANGVKKMWMRLYYKTYAERTLRMLGRFLDRKGIVRDSGNDYEKIRHQMFTIGGVDFADYMDQDIMTTENKVKITESLYKVDDLRAGGQYLVDKVSSLSPLLHKVGINDRNYVLQHILVSARMNCLLKNIEAEELKANGSLINTYFIQVHNAFQNDNGYKELLSEIQQYVPIKPMIKGNKKELDHVLQQIYTINGVDVSQFIDDFDVRNVPLGGRIMSSTRFTQHPFLFAYTPEGLALEVLKNKKKDTQAENSVSTETVSHISEDFCVSIPNFRAAILTQSSEENMQEILSVVQSFNAIPEVLRGCDTEAKRRYAEEHPDTIVKLKLGREYLAN